MQFDSISNHFAGYEKEGEQDSEVGSTKATYLFCFLITQKPNFSTAHSWAVDFWVGDGIADIDKYHGACKI